MFYTVITKVKGPDCHLRFYFTFNLLLKVLQFCNSCNISHNVLQRSLYILQIPLWHLKLWIRQCRRLKNPKLLIVVIWFWTVFSKHFYHLLVTTTNYFCKFATFKLAKLIVKPVLLWSKPPNFWLFERE